MNCTIFSDSGEEKLTIVVRINLYRSLRSTIVSNSVVTLEVVFASEFCDAALSPMAIRSYDLMASFIRAPMKDGHVAASLLRSTTYDTSNDNVVLCKFVSVNDKTAVYKVRFPSELGQYQLLLFSRPKVCNENVSSSNSDNNTQTSVLDRTITAQTVLFQGQPQDDIVLKKDTLLDGICILPLLTDVFELIAGNVGKNLTTPLLSCYRVCAGMVIKEEYGHTIGSHVYDSSIVMLRYLNNTLLQSSSFSFNDTTILSCSPSPNDVVMELGSGCGLVSIWLSQHISMRVVATDLDAQLPFLRSNVHLNALPSCPLPDTKSIQDDETTHSSSQTQISLTLQSSLPLVTRLDWKEFRTKINQQDSLPQNGTKTTISMVQNLETSVNKQKQSQTRIIDAHQQDDPQVYQDGTDGSCYEHTSETEISPPSWTFCQTYQSNHMGLASTDEIAMIIACDVLYDRTIVNDFFAVVRSFSKRSPSRTVLLLAQKLRNYGDHDVASTVTSSTILPPTVDVTQIKGFVCHKVWEEAQVVIWKMWMDSES